MKKTMCLMLIFCIIISGLCTTNATELGVMDIEETQLFSIPSSELEQLYQIPIFITYLNNNVDNLEYAKKASLQKIKDAFSDGNMSISSDDNQLNITTNLYNINEVRDSEKCDVINNMLFQETFKNLHELIKNGTKVNYVNLYVKQSEMSVSSNNNDDPAYWEANCQYLGTYDSYKFLYLESASNVESSWVTPGNISPSINWTALARKSLVTLLDHYVGGAFYGAFRAVQGGLSTFFSFVDTPLSVTYGSSSGYIKAKVTGDLYHRTVLIKDKLNRVDGYAYYIWGSTQQFRATLKIDAKWPVSIRSGGTYNYDTDTRAISTQTSQTPGFYGNSTFYNSVIDLYENTIGYFTHNESIDVNSVIANLLS